MASNGTMSSRLVLDPTCVANDAAAKMTEFHAETLREVQGTVARDRVVVVGMAQNPHVKNVRKALKEAKIEFTYLEYGNYFSEWRKRLAIKMWSGWPTFPQVFVQGRLIGGEELTKAALASGVLKGAGIDVPAVPSRA